VIVVVQRVSRAAVRVEGEDVGSIGRGLLLLAGLESGDGEGEVAAAADRIPRLRIFEDSAGKMNLSLADSGGDLLAVSQFTLAGSLERGLRPSFDAAMRSAEAAPLFDRFVALLRAALPGRRVETGRFGATMEVELVNDGPVTFVWRSGR
jgi:D-tyrosyl-tRNA(Tyr) deacylase